MFKGKELILALLFYLGMAIENVFALNTSEKAGIRDENDVTDVCFKNHTIIPLTLQEKELILELHNRYRNFVAEGRESRGSPGPQPPASNMHVLSWNENLELSVQKGIHQCNESYIGNINVGVTMQLSGNKTDEEHIIESWFREVKYFDQEIVQSFTRIAMSIGRYTRFVWAVSKYIGCVRFKRQENLITLICKYSPRGNIVEAPVYDIGLPCSNCPKESQCSQRYSGLCTDSFAEKFEMEVVTNSARVLNIQNFKLNKEVTLNSNVQFSKQRVQRQDVDMDVILLPKTRSTPGWPTPEQSTSRYVVDEAPTKWDEILNEWGTKEELNDATEVFDHDRIIVGSKKYRKGVWVEGICTCPTELRSCAPVIDSFKRIVYVVIYLIYHMY